MILARIGTALLLIAMLATPALPQGSCQPYHVWEISGSSSVDPNVMAQQPWLDAVANQERLTGVNTTNCTYTWNQPTGNWSGDCYGAASRCTPWGPSESSCPTCSKGSSIAGKPINLSNGDVYIQQNDITVPGLGNGLTLTRTWNSIWPSSQNNFRTGIFGPNWRSTYEERIFDGDDGTVKYARADGSFWSFVLTNTAGTFQLAAPANGQATLLYSPPVGNMPAIWTLEFENGEQRVFDTVGGTLTAIIDRNGNTTQLTYNAVNQLTTVTDPASRQLYFNYGSNNLLTSVTSNIGISLSYAYDGNGRLTTVTEPDQTTISFQYNANSLITAVLDSNGIVLESHTYDSYGRGLTSSRAGGIEAVTVSYPTQ